VSLTDKLARKRNLPQMPAASGRSLGAPSDEEGEVDEVAERTAAITKTARARGKDPVLPRGELFRYLRD
jgi:hypothetical protein